MILAGDIGGTHTRLALFDKETLIIEKKFASREFRGLEEIAQTFLAPLGQTVARACFGIAGPLREGKCQATNLPWVVDAKQLSRSLHIPVVYLLNDLEAHAYGLKRLKKEERFCLQEGKSQKGNQALIAAGTGLGEACLYWDGKDHRPFACEGGHADFAPRDEQETELFLFLKKKFGHVSCERVVSGPGLLSLYQFLIETKRGERSSEVKEAMQQGDPAKIVSEWGSQKKDPVCAQAVDWFLSLYGAESGNLALKFLSLGGFFIGGGIAAYLFESMKRGAFVSSFINKGRFKALLETIPIWVILNDDAALLGAAYFAVHAHG